jgi:SH3-like domain-containing protein
MRPPAHKRAMALSDSAMRGCRRRLRWVRTVALAVLVAGVLAPAAPVLPATAPTVGPSGLPLPRFASLGSSKINLRKGPGTRYPIMWVYLRRGLPVEIIAEYDLWRQIRDHDNTVGWVQKNLLSGTRTGLVTGAVRALRDAPAADAETVALLAPGVIGRIGECKGDWCALQVKDYEGWIRRDQLWGVFPEETTE